MHLRFQSTPVNLNAQIDSNNNKLYKFKIVGHAPGACLPGRSWIWALPNSGSGLAQLQLG